MYNELIKDLRQCADEGDCEVTCDGCGHFGFEGGCMIKLMRDAADAIERLTDEIDRKDKALQAWVKTWESRKENAIRHICDHCDTPIEVRLRVCGECPIVQPIREVFDE